MKIPGSNIWIDSVLEDSKDIYNSLRKNSTNLITDELLTAYDLDECTEHLDKIKQPYVVVTAHTKSPNKKGYAVLVDMKSFYKSREEEDESGSDNYDIEAFSQTVPLTYETLTIEDLYMFEDDNNV